MIHIVDGAAQERDKYAEIWAFEQYRKANSPGEENVARFMSVMQPEQGSVILDIGCGSGIAGQKFGEHGLDPWWLDITPAALNPDIDRRRFIEAPLWADWPSKHGSWDYGFCCDVLEHIPPVYTMLCIERILSGCHVAWLQISNLPDKFGPALFGQPLHLTVQPYSWWLVHLATVGVVIDARDLCGSSLFVVTR